MIKYTIKYEDFNGNAHADDLWFHISKSSVLTMDTAKYNEILQMGKAIQQKVPMIESIQKISSQTDEVSQEVLENNTSMMNDAIRSLCILFDKLIDLSYGIRSDDGLRFVQNDKVLEEFKQTVAYDTLIAEMISNPDKMVAFIKSVMPVSVTA